MLSPLHNHEEGNQIWIKKAQAAYKQWNDELENALRKGKENSPSKRRRKAASPEEIAELAKETSGEEAGVDMENTEFLTDRDDVDDRDKHEGEDLNQYRGIDLTPLEHVMSSGTAGDLITSGTPVRAGDVSLFTDNGLGLGQGQGVETPMASTPRTPKVDNTTKYNSATDFHATPSSPLPSALLANYSVSPTTLTVEPSPSPPHSTGTKEDDHPPFTTIIALLPQAMFWAAAAPVVKYASKAYDVLIEKMTGLGVNREE